MKNTKLKPLLSIVLAGAMVVGLALLDTASGRISPAHADQEVTARRSAPVLASPGEQARVVTRVEAGDTIRILKRKGRWIKVRANGRTGWITQSNVSTRQARESVRNRRSRPFVEGRSRRRRFKRDAPDDRVGADATEDSFLDEERRPGRRRTRTARRDRDDFDDHRDLGDEDEEEENEPDEETVVVVSERARLYASPDRDSRRVDTARQGDEFFVIERDGAWIRVEDERGQDGWIRSSDVGSKFYRHEKMAKRGFVKLGYASVGQKFSSSSASPLGNYTISSGAAVVGAGGELIYDYSEQYLLAADALYRYSRASPGIRYQDPNGTAVDIGFQMHQIDAGIRAGYKVSRENGMAVYARAGYHYGKYAINDVEDFEKNLAKLPSEILKGITVGALVDVPQVDDKIAVRIGLDALYPNGSREQTRGLEDGGVSDVFALWGTGQIDYQWKPNVKLSGTYQYYSSTTKWTGQAMNSQRDHMAEDAERSDTTHTLMVGLGRSF